MRTGHAAERSRVSLVKMGWGVALALAACSAFAATPPVDGIKLPPGFQIEVWADNVPLAREMAISPKGTVFVGTMRFALNGGTPADKVYAIRTVNGKRVVSTFLTGLNNPNGVVIHNGALYVAEINRISRYDDVDSLLDKAPQFKGKAVEIAKLPPEQHHGWRYIAFGPDGKLYVPIGAPCNVCDKDKDGYAQILRMNADGSGREIVAHGVRNSVGFAWQPQSSKLWFTDNGRDLLGDNVPDCELNRVDKVGAHYGFPLCHAGEVADPEFGKLGSCAQAVSPVQKLGPHVAPLGIRFYTGSQFPAEYKNQAFIAEHGSWNRSQPIGYRIMTVKLDGDKAVGYQDFATGFLTPKGDVTGRPVDLQLLPDGSMLVSDDQGGAIYRISYKK